MISEGKSIFWEIEGYLYINYTWSTVFRGGGGAKLTQWAMPPKKPLKKSTLRMANKNLEYIYDDENCYKQL